VRISERNASALPPTATSTMKMKKLVAATAEPALFCPLPDALPGAEDPPGVAPGDGVTSPTAGAAVGVGVAGGVGRSGVGVAAGVGAATTMVRGLQSLTEEFATENAQTWCWPAPAAPAGGGAVMVAVHTVGLPLEDEDTCAAHVPSSHVKVTLSQLSSLCRYVKVAEMAGAGLP